MEAQHLAPTHSDTRATQRESLRREQWVILILIVALTLAAWAYTAYHVAGGGMSEPMDMSTSGQGMASHMGHAAVHPAAPAFAMFVPMWIVMCFAMMLPTVWPMAFAFAAISRKRQARGAAFAPTWTFLLGYLIVWGLFGVACWAGAVGLFGLLGHWLADKQHLMVGTGALFVAAGAYQLSPLKNACLTTCRHPLLFVIHHWREGYLGAVLMGMHHGGLCVGCCWALMVVLFPLGMMNLLWMGLFTLVMYLEKNIRYGVLVGRIAGGLLLAAGSVLLLMGGMFLATGTAL
jgi:predicted metal-binding membrane protein